MGGSVSTVERRSSWDHAVRHGAKAARLRVDDERPHLGGFAAFDRRHAWSPAADAVLRQRSLLARLIGGEAHNAEAIAGRLISSFGSIGAVLGAPPATLAEIIDDAELADRLGAARAAVLEGLGETVLRTRFDLTDAALQQWIVGLFKGLRRERIHLALLDSEQRLIWDEPLSDGTLSGVAGSLRKIVLRGLGVDASGVVLMHNHPSGNVKPSKSDIEETRRIAYLLASLDLHLADHLVVAGNAIFSMRGAGLI